jgi:hypothetical protein
MMHLGITGTRKGLTEKQFNIIKKLIKQDGNLLTHFHHGDCMGVDVQVAMLFEEYQPEVWIISHPSNGPTRAHGPCDEVMRPKDYLVRDQDNVNASDYFWAAPDGIERVRSGTWATVRMARKKGIPIVIVMPDGEIIYD